MFRKTPRFGRADIGVQDEGPRCAGRG
jgi:hypothetical protein